MGEELLASRYSSVLWAGDLLITRAGETHGLEVLGGQPFVYFAVITPPEDVTRLNDAKE